MANLKDLEKYLNYEFSSGCYTGEDYKTFERKYISFLKAICNNNNWRLVKVNKNHYEFSVFYQVRNYFIYLSISDVRYFKNEWYNHILIRIASNEKDYTGGRNNYCSLPKLSETIKNLIIIG